MTTAAASPEILLVITGAGASYDCLATSIKADWRSDVKETDALPSRPFSAVRPPLANELVDAQPLRSDLVERYEQCLPIVAELRRRRGEGLEKVLSNISIRRKDDPQLAIEMLAFRYYLRDLLASCGAYMRCPAYGSGVTNYLYLVQQLREWARDHGSHVCFVTFNYDLLLDRALQNAAGLALSSVDPASQGEHVSLLRPHGSVAWEYRAHAAYGTATRTGLEWAIETLETGAVPEVGTEIRIAQAPWVPTSVGPMAVPALALPLDGKESGSLVWPQEQQQFIEGLEGRVTKVLTIGWRGAEAHALPYFVNAARDKCPVMIVVGGPSAADDLEEVHTNLWSVGNPSGAPSRSAFIDCLGGFSGLFRDQEGQDRLNWFLRIR